MADGPDLPPAGMTWGDYIERWVAEHGSWVALADALVHRARPAIEIADDVDALEARSRPWIATCATATAHGSPQRASRTRDRT